jgi:DNA-binding beta-propeller fold protein YncE
VFASQLTCRSGSGSSLPLERPDDTRQSAVSITSSISGASCTVCEVSSSFPAGHGYRPPRWDWWDSPTTSVLSVKGTDVQVSDTIDMGGIVAHAVFTPDGKRALVVKFNDHKVSLLDVNGDKVTYSKLDLPTGQWPYNVAVAPSGKIALTADNGGASSSDGSVDTALCR